MQASNFSELYGADVRRANRRRLRVFLATFFLASIVGLVLDFSRAPQYRATARLQITPAVLTLPAGKPDAAVPDGKREFLTEAQTLTSRPLIQQVAERLRNAGHDINALGLDPVLALQSALSVSVVEGTQVVELAAVGHRPELPAALLQGIADVYRAHIARTYSESSGAASARADEEVARLATAVAAKRRAIEEFRLRHNIVSPEREENSILAEMQGLAAAQKDANKRLTEAAGKVEALRAAAAEGKGVVRAKDSPTLATLEARASQMREELREMDRRFTPEYLAMDPQARSLRARLSELEEQIKTQRAVGEGHALQEAEQELAAARESARRLQQQIEGNRQQVGAFASRFAQYKSLQEEAGQLEKTYQEAVQRQARLGATERARMPELRILEPAVIPRESWRPLYWRDAGLVIGGALLLALAATWLIELFNRPEPRPSVLVAQPVVTGALLANEARARLPGGIPSHPLPLDDRPRLAAPVPLPRELTATEVAALLKGADDVTRRAVVLLLSGLGSDELLSLRWGDIDRDAAVARIGGAAPRQVPLPPAALPLLGESAADPSSPVLGVAGRDLPAASALATQLLMAAHDAGIEGAQEIGPAALRHTYLAFLVRQGARFADIARRAGPLDAEQLAAYSQLAPAGERREAQAVEWVFPVLAQG
jgi:uncharacterized protein involved in exopolysaccharide biosynthesis